MAGATAATFRRLASEPRWAVAHTGGVVGVGGEGCQPALVQPVTGFQVICVHSIFEFAAIAKV
jgi:hypothetical protein